MSVSIARKIMKHIPSKVQAGDIVHFTIGSTLWYVISMGQYEDGGLSYHLCPLMYESQPLVMGDFRADKTDLYSYKNSALHRKCLPRINKFFYRPRTKFPMPSTEKQI